MNLGRPFCGDLVDRPTCGDRGSAHDASEEGNADEQDLLLLLKKSVKKAGKERQEGQSMERGKCIGQR